MKNSQNIKLDKFITDYCNITRVIPLDIVKENPALVTVYNALILKSLKNIHGTKEYHDFIHENYGASFIYRLNVYGDYAYLGVKTECVSKEYLPSSYDAFGALIEETRIALFENPEFDDELIENNKKELEIYIRRTTKMPYKICYKKAFLQIDKDHRFNIDTLGTIEDVRKVTKEKLIEFHNRIQKYPISYIYQGNNKFNQFEVLIKTFKDDFELPVYYDVPFAKREYIYNEEEFDNPQSFIIMIYSVDFNYSLRNNYILRLLNNIIGGQNSILFDEIREKRGLCYSIFASNYTSESVINITTQVSRDTIEETISSIDEIIANLPKYCSKRYFEIAKMDLIGQIIDVEDDALAMFNQNSSILYKRNREFNFKECIDAVKSITYEEVVELGKTLTKLSTYVVKGNE